MRSCSPPLKKINQTITGSRGRTLEYTKEGPAQRENCEIEYSMQFPNLAIKPRQPPTGWLVITPTLCRDDHGMFFDHEGLMAITSENNGYCLRVNAQAIPFHG